MTNMRPVYDMLTAASARRSGHMPGHKGRPPFGAADLYALDTTELPNTDDLYAAEGGLREAMRLYAQAAACPPGLLRRRDAGRCFPADCGGGASSRDESRCG